MTSSADNPNVKTVHVPHLGGTDVGYQMPFPYDASKPTLVLVNSFTTSSDLYTSQYKNKELTDNINLLALELYGHGATRTKSEQFTYWDTAIANIQVLDALGIKRAFVLGTSQGGWICARMALLAPDRIEGIIPLGTSMDAETERTRKLGCWDGHAYNTPSIEEFTTKEPTPNFELPTSFCDALIHVGVGDNPPPGFQEFWRKTMKANYKGDDGRRRARMASINLRDRDTLHGRLSDIKCPVLWLHGTKDLVYSVSNAQEEIKLFTSSPSAQVQVIQGGAHFLSASNPQDVDQASLKFIQKWAKK